ncbi:PREDICTED: protein mesh-like [Priapulus caudatus]|uniref:Protein mesh-like n=1 Tax=Priapulus caudatus TaxID=37621 RepID=A0ABM1E3Q7_PRICU|nr:PREDICTED: protein mesh-like [Priapulus caudatus]
MNDGFLAFAKPPSQFVRQTPIILPWENYPEEVDPAIIAVFMSEIDFYEDTSSIGFNAGNGTEWWGLAPFSGTQGVARIDEFTSVGDTPGRWVFRVDEVIERGGCTNVTQGVALSYPSVGTMFGGESINISGPCFVEGPEIKARFETLTVDCLYVNATRATCILPMFFKSGAVQMEISHDGSMAYNFKGWFFIAESTRYEPPRITLEPSKWWTHSWQEDEEIEQGIDLEIVWDPFNITYKPDARLDIGIWGYRELAKEGRWEFIDVLATGRANDGVYKFKPKSMTRNNEQAWSKYDFGAIRLNVTNYEWEGHYWSQPTPLAWYNQPGYIRKWGSNWPYDKCMKWHDLDSEMTPILNSLNYCPCTVGLAESDKVRWVPDDQCNKYGKLDCEFNKGATHCVRQAYPNLLGASQHCCYDIRGNLMHVFDSRYGSKPDRSHPWGIYPHLYPPRIPDWCHYQYDAMPYYFCCEWGDFCDPFFWRRPSDDCQTYMPPKTAIAFGDPHFITFDGHEYSFNGKGEFTMFNSDHHHEDKNLNFPHKMTIQGRFEQPPNATVYVAESNATMLTAVVGQENNSAVVEVQSRAYHARWRYKMTVLVNGRKVYFDRSYYKAQVYEGVTVSNPYVNLNQSEIMVSFASGAGFQVTENHGALNVVMFLPQEFKYFTRGLFGTWSDKTDDEFRTAAGTLVRPSTNREIFYDFGETWRIPGTTMFTYKPGKSSMYYYEESFEPEFAENDVIPLHPNATMDMNGVLAVCGGNNFCKYDYIMSGDRYLASGTKVVHETYERMVEVGLSRQVSCMALPTPYNGQKHYINYLEGAVVRFNCLPGFEFWGTEELRCMPNGQWSDGISVLCRSVIGATKFTARYAFITTWDRVTFKGSNTHNDGGPPLNTFQVACATDEVHTFCVHNYDVIRWAASANSGGHPDTGLGGTWGAVQASLLISYLGLSKLHPVVGFIINISVSACVSACVSVSANVSVTFDVGVCVIGATKFTARYAFITTWDRVTFKGSNTHNDGGPPLNTFQVACATDEVHTFCVHNYDVIRWAASANSGGHPDTGLGGTWGAVRHDKPRVAELRMRLARAWVSTLAYFGRRLSYTQQ